MLTFEEFKKMELKTGKIVSVENHPNADRLYILKIDVGGEQKQSVAGLRPYLKPEELLNKTVVVLTNLQPGNLRGVESQAMVLVVTVMDGESKNIVLLVPEKEVPSGCQIS